MSGLIVQFHALSEEISDLFAELFDDSDVYIAEVMRSPLRFQMWSKEASSRATMDRRMFVFSLTPITLDVKNMNDFHRANVDALFLELGGTSPAGLAESCLSSMTDDEVALRRWKEVMKRLRKNTLLGAIAVNPKTGASCPMRSHRFTVGAQYVHANGIAILPFAGHAVIKLPPPA